MREVDNQTLHFVDDGDEISILDILLIIAEGKKTILSFLFVFLIMGIGYGLFIQKPEYASSMQIAPISQNSPKAGNFNIFADGNLISGILLSDSVLDSVIERNNLLIKDDGTSSGNIAVRKTLKNNIETKVDDRSGIINVEIKNESPQKAFEIAESLYDSALVVMHEMGITISDQKNSYIISEIEKNIKKIQTLRKHDNLTDTNKEIDELLRTLSLFSLYREGAIYREEAPLVIQLISAPKLPDQALPRGRGKTLLLSAFLGLFLGLAAAFLKHFWQTSLRDPESMEKVERLKSLLSFKNK